jgi:hypothetical protein
MLLKANQLMPGDRLVIQTDSVPKLVTEVNILDDGVKVTLENGTIEWYVQNKIVIAHRPVQ